VKPPIQSLPPLVVSALADPRGHPHDPDAAGGVEQVQTHISHVFMTRGRVYKLRKAVSLGFLSFATRGERNADCLREVALNRRLAPDVYLGVAPVHLAPAPHLGPVAETLAPPAADGTVLEHCVVMRRLPAGRDALSLLERGELRPEQLDRLARCVARFHASHGLGRPAPFTAEEWLERSEQPVHESHDALDGAPGIPPRTLARVREATARFLREHGALLEARRPAGRAVDGHGDLHLQHVWFERDDAEPLLIDCIEFREDLRRIDPASEVAFLAMDLAYRRRPRLAERFLRAYAEASDDFGLYELVDFHASYRAAVRAKVAALAARDAAVPAPQRRAAEGSARRHLALAARSLAPRTGALVLVCGGIGSGKTTVANILADELAGPVIASDRLRKRLAGLAAEDRLGAGFYDPASRAAIYEAMLERAAPALRSGRSVVLDATFARRAWRQQAGACAERLGVPAFLVETRCAEAVVLERLRRRARAGSDASDAGPELLRQDRAAFEATAEWPRARRFRIDTDGPRWRGELRALAAQLRREIRARQPAPGAPGR